MLSNQEITIIIAHTAKWTPKREISRITWHARWTISRYTNPKVLSERIVNLTFWYNLWSELYYQKKEEAKLYKKLSIICSIAFIIQTFISIFI